MSLLEKEMNSSFNCIATELNISLEDLNIRELTRRYPELREFFEELENVTVQLKRIHDTNAQLIEQALKIVNFTVNLLSPSESNTYKRPEQKDLSNTSVHLVDWKV